MRRTLVILLIIPFCLVKVYATDLTFGEIISPADGQKLNANQFLSITFQVKNINVLPANSYMVIAVITSKTDNKKVYESSVSGADIVPGTTQTLSMPQQWLMEFGTFSLELHIAFAQDINPANNNKIIELAVSPCCFGIERWRRGPAPMIFRNLNIFPKGEQLQRMRPGDLIAVSAYVQDFDMLEQNCVCVVNGDSLRTTRFAGPYQDQISYTWSLSGPGKLIQPEGNERSAVLYEIPLCDTSPAIIQCTVANTTNSDKAADEIMKGGVMFHFSVAPNLLPANSRDIGNARFLSVIPTIDTFKAGNDELLEPSAKTSCTPDSPQWLQSAPLSANSIQSKSSDLTCPDYLALLYVTADDFDSLLWRCDASENDACRTSRSPITHIQSDALQYDWSLVGGSGVFPLGYTGQCVVFWRAKNDTALVQCRITDSRLQYKDEQIILTKHVGKAKNPKAYIGVGNISYSKLGINFGDNKQLEDAALLADKSYSKVGYDVDFDAYAALVPNQSVQRALRDPCTQAVWIVGHGTNEDSQFKGTIELSDEKSFTPYIITKAAKDAFTCNKHPFLRELVLMGCYSGLAKWGNATFSSRIYGFPGQLWNARWFMHEVYNWEQDQHFPPEAHDLRVP